MIIYTLKDYLKIYKLIKINTYKLREDEERYVIQEKSNHNKHDKIFRDILNDKKEVTKIINTYIKPKTKLNMQDLEKYETRYITKIYEERLADIVYKIKGKEIFFLIEHQTKVDKKMAYRILEYSMEIIRGRIKNIKGQIEKAGIPTVIPIVIYTGEKLWNAKQEITEMKVKFETIKKVETITGYNLIDIRDKEKAIKDDLFISKISIIERLKNTDEIIETIEKIYNNLNRKEDKKKLLEIIDYLLEDEIKINKKTLEKLNEKIIKEKEGGIEMMHAKEVLRRDRLKAIKDGENRGLARGILEGKLSIARKMLEEKIDVIFIEKITGLTKEEIEKATYINDNIEKSNK